MMAKREQLVNRCIVILVGGHRSAQRKDGAFGPLSYGKQRSPGWPGCPNP
jgi:hypothetical protein